MIGLLLCLGLRNWRWGLLKVYVMEAWFFFAKSHLSWWMFQAAPQPPNTSLYGKQLCRLYMRFASIVELIGCELVFLWYLGHHWPCASHTDINAQQSITVSHNPSLLEHTVEAGQQGILSRSQYSQEDGTNNRSSSDSEAVVPSEQAILTLMEFMALSRPAAIECLVQNDGDVQAAIANLISWLDPFFADNIATLPIISAIKYAAVEEAE